MFRTKQQNRQKGIALVIVLIFVTVFSALSVSLFTMSTTSVQASTNHRSANGALNAAQSGLEFAKYLASSSGTIDVVLDYQAYKDGDFSSEADTIWSNLCSNLQSQLSGCSSGENWIQTSATAFDGSGSTFTVRFERSGYTISAVCTGADAGIERTVKLSFEIGKEDDEILNYGIVGRGRMWLTGDTTIYGDIYSSWTNASVSPFNMTEDSTVLGTINTAISKSTIDSKSWDLETLDSNGKAMFEFSETVYDAGGCEVSDSYGTELNGYLVDSEGNYVYDAEGNQVAVDYSTRITSSGDEIQGTHEGINYGEDKGTIDDYLDIDTYDTSYYTNEMSLTTIEPVTTTETRTIRTGRWPNYTYTTEEVEVPVTTREYFPHGEGGYDVSKSGSVTLDRYTYEDTTFTNAILPANQNALFKNCTFEDVLYIDCSTQTSSEYNNVRFENCEFNGVIVTNTPDELNWRYNALYFTGSANFNNTSDIQEATILAPHFNVNLGDANNGEVESDENIITGAVVGGIVDIRGNAEIFGTVISMCDTSQWTSGFVTNIGATLNDGGSETTSVEDVGTINITPDREQTLFPGLKEYPCTISLSPQFNTYEEAH